MHPEHPVKNKATEEAGSSSSRHVAAMDIHILNSNTAWQLWYCDTFDREAAASLEASGSDLVQGLYELWMHTIQEGILDNGNASFSYFQLSLEGEMPTTIDIGVQPFHNRTLQKLRQWVTSAAPQKQGKHEFVWILAQLHFTLLQTSSRWTARAIDRSAEAQALLARIDEMTDWSQLNA